MRLVAVLLAGVLGAVVGFGLARQSVRWQSQSDIIGFVSGLGGLTLVYVVSGARFLAESSRLHRHKRALESQLRFICQRSQQAADLILKDSEHDESRKAEGRPPMSSWA